MTDDPDEDDGQAAKQLTGRYRGLKPWKKGEASPNPGGRPRQHHEMVAKLRMSASEIVDELLSLAFKKKPTNSDKIRAGILRDVWEMMFGKPPQAVLVAGGLANGDYTPGDGTSGLTVLLQRARYEKERQAAKQLAKEPDPALTPAEVEISPLEVMSTQVRMDTPDGKLATEREVLGSIVGKERAAELIGAPAPARVDFVAPAPASGLAPVAIPAPASAREAPVVKDEPAAPATASAAGASRAEGPAPESKPESPPPAGRKPTGFPGFDNFSAIKTKERAEAARIEELRKMYPGQVPASVAFPPDAPGTGPQGTMEIVNFTRIPGSKGIRRVS